MHTSSEKALEKTLQAWEDYCLLREAFAKARAWMVGADLSVESIEVLTKWKTYRRTLLTNSVTELRFDHWCRRLLPELQKELDYGWMNVLGLFPLEFFAWTRKSRKAFVVEAPEQNLFSQATFPDVRWEDILWPFESFMIELTEPLKLEEGTHLHQMTHILVSQIWFGEIQTIWLRLIDITATELFSKSERYKLREALSRRKEKKVEKLTDSALERLPKHWKACGSLMFRLFSTKDQKPGSKITFEDDLTSSSEKTGHLLPDIKSPNLRKVCIQATKIVLGTCLFLESISQTSPEHWRKRRGEGRPYMGPTGIITDETAVCTIGLSGTIDPTKQETTYSVVPKGKGFVRPHWRRSHRRRPTFTPPDHPKTIKVPAKLINEHWVPLFGIVSGSVLRILSDE